MSKLHWEGNPIDVLVCYNDEVSSTHIVKRFHAQIETFDPISNNKRTRKCIAAMLSKEKGYEVENLDLIHLQKFYRAAKLKNGKHQYSIWWSVKLTEPAYKALAQKFAPNSEDVSFVAYILEVNYAHRGLLYRRFHTLAEPTKEDIYRIVVAHCRHTFTPYDDIEKDDRTVQYTRREMHKEYDVHSEALKILGWESAPNEEQ